MCRRIGVTGTREGANSTQILSVIQFLKTIEQPAELHHGDCKGVDEEVAVAAGELGFKVVCHPPEDATETVCSVVLFSRSSRLVAALADMRKYTV